MGSFRDFPPDEGFPLIQPQMWGGKRKDRVPNAKRMVLKQMSKNNAGGSKFGNGTRGGHPARGGKAAAVKTPPGYSRRVIVKARIIKNKINENGSNKAAKLHVSYIQRDGVGIDDEKGRLFGDDKLKFSEKNLLENLEGEINQFRFIISPEDGHELDLEKFTKDLMKQIEIDLGRELIWGGACHYNTSNPHAHIVIRGVDWKGSEVRIDREYISNGIRNRAREISNRELGLRTELEVENSLNNEISQTRFTSLDYQIEKLSINNIVDFSGHQEGQPGLIQTERLSNRIKQLKGLGFVEEIGYKQFELKEGWETDLKELGYREDIIKTIHAETGRPDTNNYKIYDKTQDLKTEGLIIHKGIANELYDTLFVLVETPQGQIHYIPVSNYQVSDIYVGQIVKFETKKESWLKPSDHNIANVAGMNNGVYSAEKHEITLVGETIIIKGKKIDTKDFVEAHQKRVQRLCTFGLSENMGDNNFIISENLVEELTKRDQIKPINKLEITPDSPMQLKEMVTYKGRTYLDRFTADLENNQLNKVGFGGELVELAKKRAQFVKGLGIDPSDPARAKKLDEIEKQDLVKKIRIANNFSYVSVDQSHSFKGQLKDAVDTLSGKKFALVESPHTQEFAMVPWQPKFDKLRMQNIQLLMNSNNRFVIKTLGIGR